MISRCRFCVWYFILFTLLLLFRKKCGHKRSAIIRGQEVFADVASLLMSLLQCEFPNGLADFIYSHSVLV